jgi:hypothetical protein
MKNVFYYKGRSLINNELNKPVSGLKVHKLFNYLLLCSAILISPVSSAAPTENNATASILGTPSVDGIQEGEIFQRDMPQNSANITIKLNLTLSTFLYKYYSISLLDDRGVRQSVLSEGYYNGSNLLSFSLSPQSKFRKIRLSFYDSKSTERLRWNSPTFNVGEVFIVAGQSNVANHGDTESNANVITGNQLARMLDPSNPGIWKPMVGPLPYATSWDAPRNGSPWESFANELGTRLASMPRYGDVTIIPIGVVNVAYGGSSLEVWDPKATTDQNGVPMVLFNRLTLAASSLKHYTPVNGVYSCAFRAVLWHQGESNSNRDFDADKTSNAQEPSRKWYADRLKNVAQNFRDRTGCSQPWMVAKASWLAPHWRTDAKFNPSTKFAAETEIREGQIYLSHRIPLNNNEPVFKRGPDTDMLTGDDPANGARKAYRSDGIHMNSLGLSIHGKLWASYVANMIDSNNQPLQTEKDLIPEVSTIYNMFINVLGRTAEENDLDNEGMRYWTQVLTLNPATQNDIQNSFLNSDERYIRNVFQNTVGRRPTWWELNYWVAEMSAKRTTRENLAMNDRVGFENTLSPNAKKIFRLYVTMLGRRLPDIQSDMAGLNYWTNILNSNPSLESVLPSILRDSPEYRVRVAFVNSKGRQPTQDELLFYMPKVTTSISDAWLSDNVWVNAAK